MIPVEQQVLAVFDENGDRVVAGDCMRACVASVFELPLEDVPHFAGLDDWYGEWLRWLEARGLGIYDARIRVDEDDPTKLLGHPAGGYWFAAVKSPRLLVRCHFCHGDGQELYRWDDAAYGYVVLDEPRPCATCDASGRVPGLHLVVMEGGVLVWDPHPQREQGHLGFVSGEILRVLDPARL